MKRDRRLRQRADFAAVFEHGRAASGRLLALRARANPGSASRFGFAVGKRVGNAVTRNLVRRRLREIVRQTPIVPGFDIVFVARNGASAASFAALRHETILLLRRQRLLGGAPADAPCATFGDG